uniref:DUF7660 domain-containing protein n=1 Tax=Streptomyces auratus AGR0001 TaxID=1160718 RepID=J1ZWJ2_9ACTN
MAKRAIRGRTRTSLGAWIDDADGWYSNAGRELPANADWSFFAQALRAATTYE